MRSIAAIVLGLFAVACFQGCGSESDNPKPAVTATGGAYGTGGSTTGGAPTGGTPAGNGGTVAGTGGAATGQSCPTSAAFCPATGAGTACCVNTTCGTDLGMGCVATVPDAGP